MRCTGQAQEGFCEAQSRLGLNPNNIVWRGDSFIHETNTIIIALRVWPVGVYSIDSLLWDSDVVKIQHVLPSSRVGVEQKLLEIAFA